MPIFKTKPISNPTLKKKKTRFSGFSNKCYFSAGPVPSGPFQFSSLIQLSYHIASSLRYETEKWSHILKMFSNSLSPEGIDTIILPYSEIGGNEVSRTNCSAAWIKKKKKKTVVCITKLWKWLLLGTGRRLQHTACGILAAHQRCKPCPRQCRCRASTTGPPGRAPSSSF